MKKIFSLLLMAMIAASLCFAEEAKDVSSAAPAKGQAAATQGKKRATPATKSTKKKRAPAKAAKEEKQEPAAKQEPAVKPEPKK